MVLIPHPAASLVQEHGMLNRQLGSLLLEQQEGSC